MSDTPIHFIGFLVNVDDSILKLKLGDNFVMEKLPQEKIMPFLNAIDSRYGTNATFEVLEKSVVLPKGYCITKQHVLDFQKTEQGGVVIKWGAAEKIHRYIGDKLRLLRLYKEGNIFLHFSLLYHMKEETPQIFNIMREWPLTDRTIFRLVDEEISQAESFIEKTKIPFPQQFLQLAFDAFELSYETHNLGMAFLSLMISLEAMLNVDKYELRYRISRNVAVLLGESQEKSEQIFKEIKEFYDKRSGLVHTGNSKDINPPDVLKLRDYVRRAIKEINYTGYGKEHLGLVLNESGFGCRPWRENNANN